MSSSRHRPEASLESLEHDIARLRVLFEPTPSYKHLPTALELFAQFQLLSQRVKEAASEALELQTELAARLEDEGAPVEEWVRRGSLTRDEGKAIKGWSRRDDEDVMFGLSLEVRKRHIAKALSSPSVVPQSTLKVIDCYFPDLEVQDQTEHGMLFIRCMQPHQLAILLHYRKTAIGWYRTAMSRYEKGRGPPELRSLVGDSPEARFAMLSSKLLREAEKCLADAKDFEAMFADLPAKGSRSNSVQGRTSSGGVSSGSVRRQNVKSESADLKKSRRLTLPPAPVAPSSSRVKHAARPRASLPAHLSRRSSSPSPEHLAALPRVTFGKRPSVTRSSLDRSMTPISPVPPPHIPEEPLFDRSPSMDVDEAYDSPDREPPAATSSAPRRSGPPPIYASRSIIPSSGLKTSPQTRTSFASITSTSSPPQGASNVLRKKRLSGLPPRAGPDFTAPLSTPTRSPGDLKPFSTAELHAGKRKSLLAQEMGGQDENSPRQAKKRAGADGREVLGGGDASQENSQESAQGIQPVLKRDKGKQRADPRPSESDLAYI